MTTPRPEASRAETGRNRRDCEVRATSHHLELDSRLRTEFTVGEKQHSRFS